MSSKQRWQKLAAEIEAVAAPAGRQRYGQCSLEGLRLFERALRADVRIERALVQEDFLTSQAQRTALLRAELEQSGCELVAAPDDVLTRLTRGRSLGGVIGLARLPEPTSLKQLLGSDEGRAPLFLVAVNLDDPGNVGALVRTAHGSGASALFAAGCTDAFHPKAVRTSMGSIFRLPILARPNFESLSQELKRSGVRLLAAVTSGGRALPEVKLGSESVAVVVGSEAFGLGPAELSLIDDAVTIPMVADVDSLSVNAAAAVLLYELGRDRLW